MKGPAVLAIGSTSEQHNVLSFPSPPLNKFSSLTLVSQPVKGLWLSSPYIIQLAIVFVERF